MGDNFHALDGEAIEQDIIEANLATLTTQVNTNTSTLSGINITNINNQLAGSTSSGLRTLITGNDTDIAGINDKLDATTGSGLKTLIDNKVSMVLGTSAGTALEGNTTTITTAQANKITANESAITAIETKTDHISVSQAVDLDDMEGDILANFNSILSTGSTINTESAKITALQSKTTAIKASSSETLTIGGNDESTNDLLIGEVPTSTTECGIANKTSYTAGSSTPYMISQANDGSIKLKGHTITITSAKDLDQMVTDIAGNTAKTGITATQILNVNPLNNYIYGRRLRLLTDVGSATPTTIDLTSSLQTLVFQNIIANGVLTYDANGNLATSATGLFHIKAKVSVTTDSGTGGGERMCKFELQTSGGTSVINGKNHLSRHDNNSLSFSAPEIDAVVRLATGTDYIFRIESDENGTGVIQNGKVENNDLIIRSLPIPSSYTLPSDYGED